MQIPNEILKGIQLPSEMGIVVSRIYNWLRELNEDVKPSSCFVIMQLNSNFSQFFLDVATKLAESAGINIVIPDNIEDFFQVIKNRTHNKERIYFESDKQIIKSLEENDKELIVYRVADSLRMKSEATKKKFPNHISIFQAFVNSFEFCFDDHLARNNREILFDFSDVRDPDEISSGKDSFVEVCQQIVKFAYTPTLFNYLKVLSDICSTIKRGGFRRHGALTATIKSNHPLADEYLDIPFGALSHLKKGISIRHGFDQHILERVCKKHSQGELFVEKQFGTSQGKELFTNVCRGLSLIPGDRCLVSPVNLGQARVYSDIVRGFKEVTQFLIDVDNHQRQSGEFLPDKQIAVGMAGLANCLRNFGTDYYEFINALLVYNNDIRPTKEMFQSAAYNIVKAIAQGCQLSADMGEKVGMRAVLAIEPTASSARRVKDWKGYDLCPNIDPPNVIPGIGVERRHSETGVFDFNGDRIHPEFNYGSDIFPAQYLTYEQHFTLWNEIQVLMDRTGMAHYASYECWGELTIERFFTWWDSSLGTIYYNKTVGTKHLEKGRAINARQRLGITEVNNIPVCLVSDPECSSCD